MSNIHIGSASWADPGLIACGRFYPPDANTAEARLRYYASQFPLVEVDSSYYGMPTAANAQLWALRTPEDFVFNVKAFRLFTGHQTPRESLHKDIQAALGGADAPPLLYYKDTPIEIRDELWRRFTEALAPLQAAGKLGAVHFQFAPWLLRNRQGMAHVAHCVEKMPGHLLAVEFRDRSWFDAANIDSTLDFERDLGVVHTAVDSPQGFDNCVPCIFEATHPELALVRLHGRNQASWNHRGPGTGGRFDYWYCADELDAMVPEIRGLGESARRVHVVFNTNNEDQGQVNARLLARLMA
ncbi:MAG: DUF72 domain-containing protein [Ramlibacter sp.]